MVGEALGKGRKILITHISTIRPLLTPKFFVGVFGSLFNVSAKKNWSKTFLGVCRAIFIFLAVIMY